MTALAAAVAGFAELLTPQTENTGRLSLWIGQVRGVDLPYLHGRRSSRAIFVAV